MTPPRPLEGMRVVEVAQALAGPLCARILHDLGAEVIKVEPPGGDAARGWGPPFHNGVGTIFAWTNTGKRSVTLDLRSDEGMAALRELARTADVFLEAMRPGTLAAMGLSPEALQELNPRLIHVTVMAYGESGPLSQLPGYEPLMQAHGGLMSVTGEKDGDPVRVGTSVVDMGTGMWTAMGVLAALMDRETTGRGRHLSGSLFDTALTWSGYHLLAAASDGTVAGRWGTELPMIAPYGTFAASDEPVMIAVGSDALFQKLCTALQLDDLATDPRLAANPDRVRHRAEVNAAIARATAMLTAAELLALLRQHGVPAAPVRDVGQILQDPQFQASGMLEDTPDGIRQPLPLRFGGERLPAPGAVPAAGQDTAEVLGTLSLPDVVREALLDGLVDTPEDRGGEGLRDEPGD